MVDSTMTVDTGAGAGEQPVRAQLLDDAGRFARIMLVAVPVGVLTTGIVSRLAMFALAKLNPTVAGRTTDDGFTIDQFTLSGSVNLAGAGVFLGIVSGVLYAAIAPLAVGPAWFRALALSLGAGVVVGDQLVHTGGSDFFILDPAVLAIAMFVAIPILHVLALHLLVERMERHQLLRATGWTVLGVLLGLILFPLTLALAAARALQLMARSRSRVRAIIDAPVWPWAARAALGAVFLLAVVSLARDVQFLT